MKKEMIVYSSLFTNTQLIFLILSLQLIMTQQNSEYELFRLQRFQGFDEDNNSAHFSLKDSNLNFSDRLQVNSSRSSPNEIRQSLQKQLNAQRKQYSQLQLKHEQLIFKYRQLQAKYEETRAELTSSEKEVNKLKQTLLMRKELQLATKKKLKEWVYEAKKGLDE